MVLIHRKTAVTSRAATGETCSFSIQVESQPLEIQNEFFPKSLKGECLPTAVKKFRLPLERSLSPARALSHAPVPISDAGSLLPQGISPDRRRETARAVGVAAGRKSRLRFPPPAMAMPRPEWSAARSSCKGYPCPETFVFLEVIS